MRSSIRQIFRWLFLGLAGALIFGVCGEWFIHVADDKGWYQNAGEQWDTAVVEVAHFFEALSEIARSTPALIAIAASGGCYLGLSLDRALRRSEGSITSHDVALSEQAAPPAPISPEDRIFLGSNVTPSFLVSHFENATWLAGKEATNKYLGKWIKVGGVLEDMASYGGDRLSVTLKVPNIVKMDECEVFLPTTIYAWFTRDHDVLKVRQVGDPLLIEGCITGIGYSITIGDCSLIKAATQSELKA